MNKKQELIAAAIAGITLGLAQQGVAAGAKKAETPPADTGAECYGINTCKGTNQCGVGTPFIKAVEEKFPGKFKGAKVLDCANSNQCAAAKGFLAWIPTKSKDECFAAGGFISGKDAKGNVIVVTKKS